MGGIYHYSIFRISNALGLLVGIPAFRAGGCAMPYALNLPLSAR
jgi:hypothetical protein